jgi:transcriptional regulator with XRE-family HTH domain
LPSQVIPAFMAHVAGNLRRLRTAAGLSQKALAGQSGVSLRMIGAIETGGTSASTAATLDRLATALSVTLTDLVADPAAPRRRTVDRLGWAGANGGEGVLRWSLETRREAETWEWRLEPGERYDAGADPQGWSVMLFVVQGRLTVETGAEVIDIESDGFLLDSTRPHAFANRTKTPVRFFRCTTW